VCSSDLTAPHALTNSTSAMFDFTSEAGATFECNLDGAGFTACPDPVTFTVAAGAHTLQVRAVDAAGNVDASPAAHGWTVDTTPPDTTIVSGPMAATATATATFDLSSEAGATFQCNRDGAGFMACADPFVVTVAEGAHTLQVRAVDGAGNVDPTPASYTWTLDTTAPTTTIMSGPSGLVNSTSAAFVFTSNEGAATFECSVDGAAFAACAATFTLTGLAQGGHTLQVRAVDAAGNRDLSPASASWSVDSIAPTVAISSPTASGSGPRVRLTYTVSDGTVTCRYDAAAFAACTSGTSTSLPAGNHTVEVRAVDAAGNTTTVPVSFLVTCAGPPVDADSFLLLRLEDGDTAQSLINAAGATNAVRGTSATVDANEPTSIASGRFGKALHFTGGTSAPQSQINWSRTAGANLTTFTIAYWARPTDNTFGYIGFHSPVAGDWVYLTWNNGQFGFNLRDTDDIDTSTASQNVAAGQWHHVVNVFDGAVIHIYVDGVERTWPNPRGNPLSFANFVFGASDATSTSGGFKGDLDDLYLSRRAWTATEVLDQYCPL